MQIDFKALEQALAPIAEIGQSELTFDAGGTTITLRVLRPFEEVEAQKFASKALASGEEQAAIEYLDLFRLGCLSHAIVAVGDQDFRDVEFVTTGEKLENGTFIKVPKYKALRQLLNLWTRSALSGVFTKFHELLMKTEKEAEKAIIFEPANVPAEIDRLHQRIAEMKAELEKAELVERTKFSDKVAQAQSLVGGSPSNQQADAPVSEAQAPAPRRTGPITPQQAAPPEERQAAPQQVPQSSQPQERPQHHPAPVAPPPRADSSFINADDDDGMNAAMNAEHNRLLEMRRRAATGQRPMDEASALETIHPQLQPQQARRRPPHQDAAEVEAEVGYTDAVAQQARHLGQMDGKDVYAMPAQDLDMPGPRSRPDRGALDPKVPEGGGSKNPRFQAPRRP